MAGFDMMDVLSRFTEISKDTDETLPLEYVALFDQGTCHFSASSGARGMTAPVRDVDDFLDTLRQGRESRYGVALLSSRTRKMFEEAVEGQLRTGIYYEFDDGLEIMFS